MFKGRMTRPLLALLILPWLLLAGGAAAAQEPPDELEAVGAAAQAGPRASGNPIALTMTRAGSSKVDLRSLPQTKPVRFERPEFEEPEPHPVMLPGGPKEAAAPPRIVPKAAAPAPVANFAGLDFATWGAGHPPDTVGDVGPTYFIQSINSSIGIYNKTGTQVAAFTFNTFMSQGAFGNLCDTNNFGDPVILYDTFEDRWVITDFAFQLSGGAVVNPPGAFQCVAVSKTGDPVSGGWNFYSMHVNLGLGDYPKFGIWPNGIYMSANVFGFQSGASLENPRVFAFNKAEMYAGRPTAQVIAFDVPGGDFTLLPSNARLQTGTPPPGTPNYFVSTWQFLNALSVYQLHVDWAHPLGATFTGPDTPLAATSWPNAAVANVPSLGGNSLDPIQIRAMMQNQYTNFGGVESLWTAHTVRRQNTAGFAAPRWYQVDVTGGTVAANLPQAATWDPDGANVMHRFVPSLALDRVGDLAMEYSTSSSTTKPAIQYAGRLAGDPVNTFSQTEQLLIQGTGTQLGTCGASTCTRWGDYSAMTLDPDGCTFWFTNMYYIADGLNHQTRIGSFAYPSCTPLVAGGTLSGTVTATVGGAPIAGATLTLGTRTATTDGSGFYSFPSLPAGAYPSLVASASGFNSGTVTGVGVVDGNTTTQNFSLGNAPTNTCAVDSTQTDFQTGAQTNADVAASPGDVQLGKPDIDQLNLTLDGSGVGITVTTWGGQTFTPSRTGLLTSVDINLFCSGCTGTTPNLTLSLRATSGGLPTGADLATATITGFSSGASAYYTATFGSPATVTAGTQYALVIRPTANPSPGTYALTRSGTSTAGYDAYAGGTRVAGATSGTVWSIPLTGGTSTDAGFKVHINSGFAASGDYTSNVKDSNPSPATTTLWTTLSWTAAVPANTTLQFQVAASNSPTGPFNFVGPDNTAATFFTTSGASLSQFNGFRYLQYKAYFSTTDSTMTPVLNDVTVCFKVVSADVAITKTDGVTTATPGGSVTYTITASNPTALAANPVTVADTFPAVLTCTWTCVGAGGGTCTASGSGNINDTTVNLPAGASVTYTAACAISAAATGTLSNTATVAFPGDPNAANDSATDTDTLTPQADLAVTKTDGVTTATPGGSVTYTITASNAGPSDAPGSTVADTFPASLTCTWTCVGAGGGTCTASGSGNVNDTVNLPAGGSVTYTASCTISAAATGSLSNTATVAAPGGVTDPTPGNNSATDVDALGASADLAITKTDGVTTATPGGSVTYTITASNAGPSDAPGSTVADTFPASLTCTWTCVGAGGGTCTASGSGNVNDTVNLPSGGSVTYTASCTISAAATGSLSNTATVTAPGSVTDTNPGNNSATDTDTLAGSADLSITKTDGVTSVTAGGSTTYTITAANAGPSNATGATVTDTFPAACTSVAYTSVAAGGATGNTSSGSGNLNDTVNLPAGGSVTYTASCTIAAAATGTLSNTATVTATGVTDPTPGNNSATDSDTINAAPGAVVTGTKTVSAGPYAVGGTITYTVTLTNSGTGAQGDNPGNELTDVLPAQLALVSANATSGTAAANTGTNTVTWNGSIPASGTVTITITATILPAAAGQTVSNQGSISYDSNGDGTNDATAQTDDPGVAGAANPTSITVPGAPTPPIPTLSTLGLMLLALSLAGLALVALRRRRQV